MWSGIKGKFDGEIPSFCIIKSGGLEDEVVEAETTVECVKGTVVMEVLGYDGAGYVGIFVDVVTVGVGKGVV